MTRRPSLQHPPQRVVGEGVDDAQPHVREGADRERCPLAHQAGDEIVVLQAPHTVVDPLGAEQVERLPHVLGRAFLPRVRDRAEALGTRPGEHPGELRGRVALLPRVEPDRGEVLAERQRLVEGALRVVLREMAQEAEDQVRR